MDTADIDRLETGSVVRSKGGRLRIVRSVCRTSGKWKQGRSLPTGSVHSVMVLKKRCSQYPAGYTFIDRWTLKNQYTVAGRIDKPRILASEIHKQFVKSLAARDGHEQGEILSCCEAKLYD